MKEIKSVNEKKILQNAMQIITSAFIDGFEAGRSYTDYYGEKATEKYTYDFGPIWSVVSRLFLRGTGCGGSTTSRIKAKQLGIKDPDDRIYIEISEEDDK